MVARMMRLPRPPAARKFCVRLVVWRTEGLRPLAEPATLETEASAKPRVAVEVRWNWKGPKASALSSLRRAVRRNRTREEEASGGGALASVVWEEEFESVVPGGGRVPAMGARLHRVHWQDGLQRPKD